MSQPVETDVIVRKRRRLARDLTLAAIIVLCGLGFVAYGAAELLHHPQQLAQAQTPDSSKPSVPAGNDNGPAESKPGGTRPTDPPPEPARPDAEAQKRGVKPALPPAPAEKMGEPVRK